MKKVRIEYYCDDGGGACMFECPDAEYYAEISDELWAEWQALEVRRDQILKRVQKLVDEAGASLPRRPRYDPSYAVKP
jgi:hypothetical protein